MVTRIIFLNFVLVASLKGGVNIGMSFNEIQNIINQVENIVTANPPTEISNQPTQEIWDSSTGSWVEQEINPVINGGGLVVNPATGNIEHPSTNPDNVVTTPPTTIPEQPPTSDNNGETGGGGSSNSNVDTDDDVPTLLSIRSKIHTLQQEMVKQVEEVRGAERSVITNWETNETTSKRVDYGDLYAVLEKLVPDNSAEKQSFSEKVEEKDSELESLEDSIESLQEEFEEKVETMTEAVKVNVPTSADLDSLFEMDIGSYSFYLDPFKDSYTGGISTGIKWDEVADWISLIVGLVAVIIYFQAVRRNITDLMQTLIEAPFTAPVSNLSIFGNSIGTAGLIVIKIGFIAGLFVSTTIFGVFVLLESNFSFGGASLSVIAMLGDITSILSGDGYMGHAVGLLFDLLPLITIASMYTAYIAQKLVTFGILTFGITLSKASS